MHRISECLGKGIEPIHSKIKNEQWLQPLMSKTLALMPETLEAQSTFLRIPKSLSAELPISRKAKEVGQDQVFRHYFLFSLVFGKSSSLFILDNQGFYVVLPAKMNR